MGETLAVNWPDFTSRITYPPRSGSVPINYYLIIAQLTDIIHVHSTCSSLLFERVSIRESIELFNKIVEKKGPVVVGPCSIMLETRER